MLILIFYTIWKSFFDMLCGIFCFATDYNGAPLWSPVLENVVMLGICPK